MAITIAVTDGSNTVTLSATDGYNESYQPQIPDAGALDVTETLEVTFIGGNAAVMANLTELEQMLDWARQGQNSPLRLQVYLKVTIDSDVWRSEIYDGKVISTDGWIKYERALGTRKVSVVIRRAPWFEADAAIYADLTNGNGTQSSAGLNFYNHNDSGTGHDNWADVGTITGDLPAPAILSVDGGAVLNRTLLAGMASYCVRANLALTYEPGINFKGAGVTCTLNSDASDTAGNYVACAWSGSTEVALNYWELAYAAVTACQGRIFRPAVRLHSAIGGSTRFWLSISANYDNSGTLEKIWQSEETLVVLADLAQILPPMQIPPWVQSIYSSSAITLALHARCEAAGAHTINLDVLDFIPCDSFLRLTPIMTTYPNLTIIYDTQTRMLFNDAKVIETHAAEGPGLWLVPGQLNRMVMVVYLPTDWPIANQFNVKLQYRPRKRTL